MRAYTVAVAASALEVDRKWLDNVLTQHEISGVHRERQGISRMITPAAVLVIAVAIAIARSLDAPFGTALAVASRIVEGGEYSPSAGVSVRVDVESIERRLAARLADAVDTHPPARRGRPPRHTPPGPPAS